MAEAQLTNQIKITLPDGSQRSYDAGVTGTDIAFSIGEGLGKASLAIKINGEVKDLNTPITQDSALEIITMRSDEVLDLIRHDCAHVMAEAVQELYPGTQVTIGPSITDGFYYDFYREEPFTPDDLPKIEKKMAEIIKRDEKFERSVMPRNKAIEFFKTKGEDFKVELIEDLPEGEEISLYSQGDWIDLCRGPHMPSTGKIGKAFKLMSIAGAYWRGDSNRPMLQRIYATAWRDNKELDAYLTRIEEAEKRDHRKLGKQLDLFHMQEEAQGSVFWHDKGYTLWRILETYIRQVIRKNDYIEVKTPQLLNSKFWEQSGHWSKFRENMFVVPDEIPNTDEDGPVLEGKATDYLALKPMNCPAHVQIFKQGIKSYRDLPIRMAEFGCCHRNEPSGALHGIMRVRQFTQDDAHIFCSEEQIISETKLFCEMLVKSYKELGFEDITVFLSTRPEIRAGSDETWDKAEKNLAEAATAAGLEYTLQEGEGAFYGPKLEFTIHDAIGRAWQCGTLQLDFVLPERLDASYIAEDGSKQRPVMLHRVVLGSMERFIGILIENYAGAFPVWLAPVQAVIATVNYEVDDYAKEVADLLRSKGVRLETDLRNEKISYKVREHSLQKVPYILALGEREAENRTLSVRAFGQQKNVTVSLDDFVKKITEEGKIPSSNA